jgi:hypothetical protein
MKLIAASHCIFFHSKTSHAQLQLAICNHICSNCLAYISVFELIDDKKIANEKRLSYIQAVYKGK